MKLAPLVLQREMYKSNGYTKPNLVVETKIPTEIKRTNIIKTAQSVKKHMRQSRKKLFPTFHCHFCLESKLCWSKNQPAYAWEVWSEIRFWISFFYNASFSDWNVLQSVRYWTIKNTTRHTLNQIFHNVSDCELICFEKPDYGEVYGLKNIYI